MPHAGAIEVRDIGWAADALLDHHRLGRLRLCRTARDLGEDLPELNLTIKTVSRPKNVPGFVVLPRRWVVERSHARVMHFRRPARDYERLIQHSEPLITWAAITLMTRRITRRNSRRSGQPASREAQGDRSSRH